MLVLHGKPTYLNKLSSICQGLKTQIESACDNAHLLSQDLKVEAVKRTVSSKSA